MDIYKIRIINTFHSLINCWTVKMFIKQFCHFCNNFLISLLTSKYSISQQYICINENQFHMKIRSLCYRLFRRGNGHIIWCQEKSVFLWSAGPRAAPVRWVGIVEVGQICQLTQTVLGYGVPLVSVCLRLSGHQQKMTITVSLLSAFSLLILISHVFLSASASC